MLEKNQSLKVFVYGNNINDVDNIRSPKMKFIIQIRGQKSILDFITSYRPETLQYFYNIDLLEENFAIEVFIDCKLVFICIFN